MKTFNSIRHLLWHIRNAVRGDYDFGTISYSQSGEDLANERALRTTVGATAPRSIRYLDIDANHPIELSNTFRAYRAGGSGVLVEPNPRCAAYLRKLRHRDVCLQAGASACDGVIDFHHFDPDVLGTFSADVRDEQVKFGFRHVHTEKSTVVAVNKIMEQHFGSAVPHFVTLDVEGMDQEIIEAFDFERYRVPVFCVETWDFATREEKRQIRAVMESSKYRVFEQLGPNTVFCAR